MTNQRKPSYVFGDEARQQIASEREALLAKKAKLAKPALIAARVSPEFAKFIEKPMLKRYGRAMVQVQPNRMSNNGSYEILAVNFTNPDEPLPHEMAVELTGYVLAMMDIFDAKLA